MTTAAALTAAAAVFAVFLGVMGLTAPSASAAPKPAAATPTATTSASTEPPTTARTEFSYSAHVGRTPAYDTTTATAPDPIFRKVVNVVDLSSTYTGPPGTFTFTADISTAAGWHSTITLTPATTFTGHGITRTVPLDLSALDARAQAAAAATGIPAGPMAIAVTATVTPPTGAPFASVLHLTMTPLELSMIGSADALVHQSAPPATPTATPASHKKPSTINLLGRHIAAGAALAFSGVVLAICALSAGALAARARWIGRRGEIDAIRRRYADLLVSTEPVSTPDGRPLVDVPEMATLAKIAERYGLFVLHWSSPTGETFVVQDDSTTYRYRHARRISPSRRRIAQRINIEAGLA